MRNPQDITSCKQKILGLSRIDLVKVQFHVGVFAVRHTTNQSGLAWRDVSP